MDFRTTPNGKRITLTPLSNGRPLFAYNSRALGFALTTSGFSVELDGTPIVAFREGAGIGLSAGPDGNFYIVAESARGGREAQLYILPEAELEHLYGEIVGRFTQRDGKIVEDSLEDLNQFAPLLVVAEVTEEMVRRGCCAPFAGSDIQSWMMAKWDEHTSTEDRAEITEAAIRSIIKAALAGRPDFPPIPRDAAPPSPTVRERLLKLVRTWDIKADVPFDSDPTLDDLGLDSLEAVLTLVDIEEEFGIALEETTLGHGSRLSELEAAIIKAIGTERNQASGPAAK